MLTKDEISGLKSLQDRVVQTKLATENAKYADEIADRNLAKWLWAHTEGNVKQ